MDPAVDLPDSFVWNTIFKGTEHKPAEPVPVTTPPMQHTVEPLPEPEEGNIFACPFFISGF